MTIEEAEKLDAISNRIGVLYQIFGRLQHKHAIEGGDVTVIMDELVALAYDIEAVSERRKREDHIMARRSAIADSKNT